MSVCLFLAPDDNSKQQLNVAAMTDTRNTYNDVTSQRGDEGGHKLVAGACGNITADSGDNVMLGLNDVSSHHAASTQACATVVMEINPINCADDKKRPLSVSSVSSSVSSSSSLPRHQRKKLATCALSTQHGTLLSSNGLNCVSSIEEDLDQTDQASLSDVRIVNGIVVRDTKISPLAMDSSSSENSSNRESCDDMKLCGDCSLTKYDDTSASDDTSDANSANCATSQTEAKLAKSAVTSGELADSSAAPKEEPHRKRGSVKAYTPLCDPHGRAPRTTQPNVTNQESLFDSSRVWSAQTFKVIQEILTTERVYVRDLQDIVQVSVCMRAFLACYFCV